VLGVVMHSQHLPCCLRVDLRLQSKPNAMDRLTWRCMTADTSGSIHLIRGRTVFLKSRRLRC
jgi:hypothetical protein